MPANPLRPPAKILRILGNPDPTLERVHVGIYDYLDSLASLAYSQGDSIVNVINGVGYQTIQQTGASAYQRRTLNFVSGVTVVDNPTTKATDVSIVFPTAYDTVQEGGVPVTQRRKLNFVSGATVSDNAGTLTTDVTISVSGITQLTGDVLAGPGSGSQVATFRSGSARSVLGRSLGSSGPIVDISAGSGTSFALRESGGSIDWGQLATPAYGTNTVTLAKIQQASGSSKLLGRGTGGVGDFQEITLGTGLSMSGTVLNGSAGTVTNVTATSPIASSGGTTPNISHNNSGVTAATYARPVSVTVNATGHVTSITAGTDKTLYQFSYGMGLGESANDHEGKLLHTLAEGNPEWWLQPASGYGSIVVEGAHTHGYVIEWPAPPGGASQATIRLYVRELAMSGGTDAFDFEITKNGAHTGVKVSVANGATGVFSTVSSLALATTDSWGLCVIKNSPSSLSDTYMSINAIVVWE